MDVWMSIFNNISPRPHTHPSIHPSCHTDRRTNLEVVPQQLTAVTSKAYSIDFNEARQCEWCCLSYLLCSMLCLHEHQMMAMRQGGKSSLSNSFQQQQVLQPTKNINRCLLEFPWCRYKYRERHSRQVSSKRVIRGNRKTVLKF